MSVYIKGMEMPKNCDECPIKAWGNEWYVCPFSGVPALSIGRQDSCPIIEIPPHGRLIDADEQMKTLRITGMDCEKCVWSNHTAFCTRGPYFIGACWAIECAPTIIPADKNAPDGA